MYIAAVGDNDGALGGGVPLYNVSPGMPITANVNVHGTEGGNVGLFAEQYASTPFRPAVPIVPGVVIVV